MNEVSLSIGGRIYRVACAPGDEERVTRLGTVVADKLAAMGNLSGHEAQNLLFAALLLADEAHEGRDTVARAADEIAAAKAEAQAAGRERAEAETELARLRDAQHGAADALEQASIRIAELTQAIDEHEHERDAAALREQLAHRPGDQGAPTETDLAPALERLAEMLEDCADKLERSAAAS